MVKVSGEAAAVEIKNGLTKQDYRVSDATATGTVTVWEKNIGMLDVGSSYKISGAMVRIFGEKK